MAASFPQGSKGDALPMSNTRSINMTSGSLWKNIFFFSIPLMFSQILEVLFNLSDVAIAGKFAGYHALGSVGSTTLLVSLFTGFLLGMGSGVNVRTAHELGVGDREAISNTIHTSLILCTLMGLLVCFACLFFAAPMLRLLDTKDELMDGAVTYLKIYALGMPAMGIYNCGNGILSACGDTRRPLYYLTIAGILNVILNLFFVIVCHMAAAGVAVASAISQYLLRRSDSPESAAPEGCLPNSSQAAAASSRRNPGRAVHRHSHGHSERTVCHCQSVRPVRRQLLRRSDGIRQCCRSQCRCADL